ncbi:uncharacterized protein [Paralichthys olivaceus]|uniref:uncharacterized protein n=1 Tax=Paralichthys olivaceus TaxID=8255 RepID=UPI003752DF0D
MKTILGLLMVLSVSGNTENVGGSVLLECNCPDRVKDKDFRWQVEKTIPIVVFRQNKTTSDIDSNYQGRVGIFVANNSSNCSLLLTDLTAADQGLYKCSYHGKDGYEYHDIYLNVSANNSRLPPTPDNLIQNQTDPKSCVRFPKVISILLLLGFCLVLWYMLKLKKKSTQTCMCHSVNGKKRELEADNF